MRKPENSFKKERKGVSALTWCVAMGHLPNMEGEEWKGGHFASTGIRIRTGKSKMFAALPFELKTHIQI